MKETNNIILGKILTMKILKANQIMVHFSKTEANRNLIINNAANCKFCIANHEY